jgi:hypothetical protein
MPIDKVVEDDVDICSPHRKMWGSTSNPPPVGRADDISCAKFVRGFENMPSPDGDSKMRVIAYPHLAMWATDIASASLTGERSFYVFGQYSSGMPILRRSGSQRPSEWRGIKRGLETMLAMPESRTVNANSRYSKASSVRPIDA